MYSHGPYIDAACEVAQARVSASVLHNRDGQLLMISIKTDGSAWHSLCVELFADARQAMSRGLALIEAFCGPGWQQIDDGEEP